jgi:hypothetical protein
MFSVGNDERYRRESVCVFCKRNRTSRSSIRMGWYHMVSEVSSREGPLCPPECSKIQLYGHHEKTETSDGDGVCSCVICTQQTSFVSRHSEVSKVPDKLG